MSSKVPSLVNGVNGETAAPFHGNHPRDSADNPADRWCKLTLLEAALIGAGLAQSDPQRMHGAVCFVAAPRFPVDALFCNVDAGLSLDEFCSEVYPGVMPRRVLVEALEVRRRLFALGPVPPEKRRRRRFTRAELDAGYDAMAADTAAEAEALEWCEAVIGDVADDPSDEAR